MKTVFHIPKSQSAGGIPDFSVCVLYKFQQPTYFNNNRKKSGFFRKMLSEFLKFKYAVADS
jgi:hypothetical protein